MLINHGEGRFGCILVAALEYVGRLEECGRVCGMLNKDLGQEGT